VTGKDRKNVNVDKFGAG